MKILKSVLSLSIAAFIAATPMLANARGGPVVVLDRGLGAELSNTLTGAYAIRIGDTKMAARAFELAWLDDKSNVLSYQAAVRAYMLSGDLEHSLALAKAGNSKLRGADADLILANDAFARGKYGEIQKFTRFDELTDGMALYARHLKAWALVNKKDIEGAKALINEHSKTRAVEINNYYSRALLLQFSGDNDGAKTAFETAYNLGGRPSIGVISYAKFLAANGDKATAIKILRENGNGTDGLWFNETLDNLDKGINPPLGFKEAASLALGNIGQAVSFDRRAGSPLGQMSMALAINPDLSQLRLNSARFLTALKMQDEAIKMADSVASDSIFGDQAAALKAAIAFENDPKTALSIIEKASSQRPNFNNRATLANYYLALEQFPQALDLYNKLIAESTGLSEQAMGITKVQLIFGRANTYIGLKQNDNAIKDIKAALELDPNNPTLLNSIGYMLADGNQDLPQAKKYLEAALEQRPDSGETIDSMGWLLFRMGDYDGALENLERAIRLAPNVSDIAEHLGDVYFVSNLKEDARLEWTKAISLSKSEKDKARLQSKLEKGIEIPQNAKKIAKK